MPSRRISLGGRVSHRNLPDREARKGDSKEFMREREKEDKKRKKNKEEVRDRESCELRNVNN